MSLKILLLVMWIDGLNSLSVYDIRDSVKDFQIENTNFSKILEFDRNIFVAGTNVIYKFDQDLNALDSFKTGPVLDSIQCSPSDEKCLKEYGELENNEPSIFTKYLGSLYILFCGSVHQGLCSLHYSKNLSKVLNFPGDDLLNYAGGKGKNAAFFSDSQVGNVNSRTLHVGMQYDGRPRDLMPKSISTRFLYHQPLHMVYFQEETHIDFKDNYDVQYLYGFRHDGFGYFVTVHKKSEVKLARVCNNDAYYHSYTELSLQCGQDGPSAATSAFFKGNTLYIAFTSLSQPGSKVCQYDISKIRTQFQKIQQDCYDGLDSAFILPWTMPFTGKTCRRDQQNRVLITEEFCGATLNFPIGGTKKLESEVPPFETNQHVTSVWVTDDVILGTQDGHIIKVSGNFTLTGVASAPVTQLWAGNRSDLFFVAGNKVGKFPMTCDLYTDSCLSCVTVTDPLGCGWCGGQCTTQGFCQNETHFKWNKACPPAITSFQPTYGSVIGGTNITINGENFGEEGEVTLEVSIGSVSCDIQTRNNTRLTCITQKSDRNFAKDVEVRARSSSGSLISGVGSSGDVSFHFVTPVLTSVTSKDFSEMTVRGDYLDVKPEPIMIELQKENGETINCKVISKSKNEITCVPPANQDFSYCEHSKCEVIMKLDQDNTISKQVDVPPQTGISRNTKIALGIAIPCSIILIAVLLCVLVRKNRTKVQKKLVRFLARQDTEENPYNGAEDGVPLVPLQRPILEDHDMNQIKEDKLYIEAKHLDIGEQIGEGHYGIVLKGTWTKDQNKPPVDVAIKTLHHRGDQYTEGKRFLEEAIRMSYFRHINVLELYGVAVQGERRVPLVVTPFMEHGDLHSLLTNQEVFLPEEYLMDFCLQTANGMNYLSSQKFIHRDLAARNCLVDGDYLVKIADFGMSRDVYTTNYYFLEDEMTAVPLKWMSPESIEYKRYTFESDVWSFGVLMWEIMTKGKSPYPEVTSMLQHLRTGARLPKPDLGPDQLYDLMLDCWQTKPELRPNFEQLEIRLSGILNDMGYQMPRPSEKAGKMEPESVENCLYGEEKGATGYWPMGKASKPKDTKNKKKEFVPPHLEKLVNYENQSDQNLHKHPQNIYGSNEACFENEEDYTDVDKYTGNSHLYEGLHKKDKSDLKDDGEAKFENDYEDESSDNEERYVSS